MINIFTILINTFLKKFNYEINILNITLKNSLILIHPPLILICYYLIILFIFITINKIKYFYKIFQLNLQIQQFFHIIYTLIFISILLGSFWAYNELGWGGWWFWDNIEIISLNIFIILSIIIHLKKFLKIKIYSFYINIFIYFIYISFLIYI